jgi:hypothetical protein
MERRELMPWGFVLLLSGCGGDGGDPSASSPSPSGPTQTQRAAAAAQTADTTSDCKAIQPFYWEIGDRGSVLASGTAGGNAPNSATPMLIASAS